MHRPVPRFEGQIDILVITWHKISWIFFNIMENCEILRVFGSRIFVRDLKDKEMT